MRIDFATLAFGYTVKSGGNTPNWGTALGQGKEHKINISNEINDLLRGMTYSSVPSEKISTKVGKGGNVVRGNDIDSPIVIGSVFSDVYVNDIPIIGGKFILVITRDTAKSHAGRLKLKYAPSNTFSSNGEIFSNQDFFNKFRQQFKLADNACWFVSDISIVDQNRLVLKTTIVNPSGPVEYRDTKHLHDAWEELEPTLGSIQTEEDRVSGGVNELYYGVPGAGKSFTINNRIDGAKYERIVFHPDYTYSDFVGQIMPKLQKAEDGEKLSYEFVPGPFIKAMKSAQDNPGQMFYLIIEEINRGNAPAIFGDIFQLLDRDKDGISEYHITNFDIGRELYGDENAEIRIPSNLSILATMNTSDQNVFTLDTAFQRRWNMKYIKNDVAAALHASKKIEGSDISWGNFASAVNEEILKYGEELLSAEDKQLGAYFVEEDELGSEKFPEKALKYLWDDAFKMDHDRIFRPDFKSIGGLIESYTIEAQKGNDPLKLVMRADVYKRMMDMSADTAADAIDESEVFEAQVIDKEN